MRFCVPTLYFHILSYSKKEINELINKALEARVQKQKRPETPESANDNGAESSGSDSSFEAPVDYGKGVKKQKRKDDEAIARELLREDLGTRPKRVCNSCHSCNYTLIDFSGVHRSIIGSTEETEEERFIYRMRNRIQTDSLQHLVISRSARASTTRRVCSVTS